MQKKKITYTYIAKKYNKGIMNAVLQGKNLTMLSAEKLAKALKVNINEICKIETRTEPYAYESIDKIKRTLRAILSLAKKQRLIEDNYARADYITFPKKPQRQISFLNDKQAKQLYASLQSSENIKYKTAIITLLLTGIRRGELCGLEWQDIDFDKGEMTIARNVTTVGGYGVIEKDPKTEMSKRTISMPSNLTNLLKEYKTWQDEFKQCVGDKWIESPKVFTAEFGGTIYPGNVLSWLKKETERSKLPHTTIHSLRHTNITMQIMAGVPLVTVSGRAGHARTSTTTDVYSHFLKSSDKQAAEKLNEIFE